MSLRSIGSNWLLTAIAVIVAYVLMPYTLQALGEAQYGTWLLITSVTSHLGLLILGLPMATIRFLAERTVGDHEDLNDAEQADSRESFRLILERCDPNLRAGESGQTMLHEVIARDHGVGVSLASILLDAGAHTDARDEFLKSTPLGWACRWGRVELVKLLLARGADPIEPEAEPWATPLAWAERRQHAEIASILREHGADR